jgi:hypothetical protein
LVSYGTGQFIRWSNASSQAFVSRRGAPSIGYLEEKR